MDEQRFFALGDRLVSERLRQGKIGRAFLVQIDAIGVQIIENTDRTKKIRI
jgi:hypothetical protein